MLAYEQFLSQNLYSGPCMFLKIYFTEHQNVLQWKYDENIFRK